MNAGNPSVRTRPAAKPAPSLLSSEATVTLKLAPVSSVGASGSSFHANIDAIAGCGAMKYRKLPPPSSNRSAAAAAVCRFSRRYRV